MNTESITNEATAIPAAVSKTSAAPAIILVVLLAAAIIAVCLVLLMNAKKKKSRNVGVVKLAKEEKPVLSVVTPEMIDAYCRAAQALEDWESLSVYASAFVRTVRLMQTSLGLSRCVRLERAKGKDEAWLIDQLSVMFSNAPARPALTASGFAIEKKPAAQVDISELRAYCQSLTPAQLKAETAKLQSKLTAKKANSLAYDALLDKVGPLLWQLRNQAQAGDGAGAMATIDTMEKTLVRFGCVPHYYDDPVIAKEEKLRVQFIIDSPEAEELPGFYVEWIGAPALIGGCAGTRREKAK